MTKEQTQVVENTQPEANAEAHADYIPFAEAAKTLGVRFQQVYQRAVVRGKMRWVDAGKRKLVHKADVQAWAKIRAELGK
jgi:excisionase family DNA binding protein